ncbi:hypothetical protein B0A49_07387 [Cryomyces minteri]|uniref:ribonuclease H n=1 Tax=Cryomyces minteri TaxID=331657 RepID=A0A4V5NG35_9PEZI|nr:hypothetical protein B0A49_07387 [Cryomyces minteri]
MPAARVFDDQGHFPETLFPPGISRCIPYLTSRKVHRYIAHHDADTLLVFTDGACSNNGRPSPRGGCAFVFAPGTSQDNDEGIVSFALEDRGPTGEAHVHTSNRAELRAVIAALQYRTWSKEGFRSLVIAIDSEYVVKGATLWINRWMWNGWRLTDGSSVKNQDLWELLAGAITRQGDSGLDVEFWRIPCGLNVVADSGAKGAAAQSPHQMNFTVLEHEDE